MGVLMNRTFFKLAASVLIMGTVGMATATEVTPKMLKAATTAANQAMSALKKHQDADAVRYAERAVLYNPSSADNRALLGQAYLQAGRFNSAETAFADTLRLVPGHGRAALGLGLVRTALGKPNDALAVLNQIHGRVPDADLGLALALAGDRTGALALLEPAARSADASPKVRQNLALVYALSGRWAEARVTASQDVAADLLDQRMTEWAKFVRPRGTNEQLATILGVKPVVDGGMPTQLALLDAEPAPALMAAAEPQPAPATEVVPNEVAVSEPAAPASEIRPVDIPQPKLVARAPVEAAKPYLVSTQAARPVDTKPMFVKPMSPKPAMTIAAIRPANGGNFVVQLGAFSSEARLEHGWNASVTKVAWLKDYRPVTMSFKNPADGRSLYRLAISGFSSRIEAVNLCRKVRERGGVCFVRGQAGDSPVQWVKRATPSKQAYASR